MSITKNEQTEADQIELRSEEVQDILGTPPRWLVQWGTTIIFVVILILFLMSWLVRYPDVVRAPIIITTPTPPAAIIAHRAGKIEAFYVNNGDTVMQGDLVGLIENTANKEDVLLIEDDIKSLNELEPKSVLEFIPRTDLQLGEVQAGYSRFTELFEAYERAVSSNYDIRKIRQIRAQVQNIEGINKELTNQETTLQEEATLAKTAWDRQKSLLAAGAASQQAVDDAEAIYLQKKRAKEQVKLELLNNNLSINDLQRQITTIKKGIKLNVNTNFVSLSESIKQLQTEIENWKKNYLLTAAVSGEVSFNPDIKAKVFVDVNTEIATILPEYKEIIGRVALPMQGSGKVDTGMRVIVKLQGFPHREYGFIKGRVMQKSTIPRDNVYNVDVELPDGLQTNRGKTLKFEQQIQGISEIITDNRSLLNRIFDRIVTAFERTQVE